MTDTVQTYADVRKLLRARMQVRTTKFPGSDLEVGVRLLTDREMDQTRLDAFKYVGEEAKRLGVKPAELVEVEPELFDREKARQIIFRAFVQPGGDAAQPFFPSVAAIRETVDAVLIQALLDLYLEHQDVRSTRAKVAEEELDRLVAGLVDQSGDVLLSYFEPETVRRVARALASKLAEVRT